MSALSWWRRNVATAAESRQNVGPGVTYIGTMALMSDTIRTLTFSVRRAILYFIGPLNVECRTVILRNGLFIRYLNRSKCAPCSWPFDQVHDASRWLKCLHRES